MTRTLLILAAAAAALAGCGSSEKRAGPSPEQLSDRLVDFSQKPPWVHSLEIDPTTDEFILNTNKGMWRITPDGGKITQVKGDFEAEGEKDTLGTFLEIEPLGDGRMVGSGHPDTSKKLPQFLGYLESDDNGRTWRNVSRLGEADLHKMIAIHDRVYAWDAVLSAMMITSDGGKTFQEEFTPPGLVTDFVVDPEDPEYILAATEEQLYFTENAGRRWRPGELGASFRLAWPAGGSIVRAEQDGTISTSDDRGSTWTKIGTVPGEPYKIETTDDPQHLYMALSDGSILETTDGGKAWKDVFRP